ncbi:MAG: MAPEG family protein [Marivita sp.]|uniref:MAPEG family protein n=1 Tax=Marivita sp. TaxID=2003365 RepID=UPI003EF33ADA
MTFPTELGILTCLMILAASLWIPYIVGVNRYEVAGAEDPFVRPTALDQFPAWVHRAHRAHLNLLEQALPFSVLVLILQSLDGFTALTYWTAIAFFWVRVLHAAGMISGIARMPIRPVLFMTGWVCV